MCSLQGTEGQEAAKPASLPQVRHFNETLEMGTFHVRWREQGLRLHRCLLKVRCERCHKERSPQRRGKDSGREVGHPVRTRTDSSAPHVGGVSDMVQHRNILLTLFRGKHTQNGNSGHDGSSQGGDLTVTTNDQDMKLGKPMQLIILNWASRKLQRVCRSSLSAQTSSISRNRRG